MSGVVITVVGLALIGVGVNLVVGNDPKAADHAAPSRLALAAFVVIVILLVARFGRGFLAQTGVLLGLLAGTAVAVPLGLVDFSAARTAVCRGQRAVPLRRPAVPGGRRAVDVRGDAGPVRRVDRGPGSRSRSSTGKAAGRRPRHGAAASPPTGLSGVPRRCDERLWTRQVFARNVGLVTMTRVRSRHVATVAGALLVVLARPESWARARGGRCRSRWSARRGLVMFATVAPAGITTLREGRLRRHPQPADRAVLRSASAWYPRWHRTCTRGFPLRGDRARPAGDEVRRCWRSGTNLAFNGGGPGGRGGTARGACGAGARARAGRLKGQVRPPRWYELRYGRARSARSMGPRRSGPPGRRAGARARRAASPASIVGAVGGGGQSQRGRRGIIAVVDAGPRSRRCAPTCDARASTWSVRRTPTAHGSRSRPAATARAAEAVSRVPPSVTPREGGAPPLGLPSRRRAAAPRRPAAAARHNAMAYRSSGRPGRCAAVARTPQRGHTTRIAPANRASGAP
ncbi:solute carrier family 23 protein [Streptomyces sp. KL116D]|uniref:solute carrier family 23 protein n=1 Tax=Streptomyces sp. KL116D TaxID=3045152 RepID=UPI00355719EE